MPYEAPLRPERKKIAIVGSGIAGLSAAWMLHRSHDIVVFEAGDHVGGHSNTVNAGTDDNPVPVDTGFIVYNERNYPNLVALFDHLNVPTKASSMSFAASIDDGRFEYCGTGLNGLLGRRRNLTSPRFWTMLSDILRFYRAAPRLLDRPTVMTETIGSYLSDNGYSDAFIHDHILPMGAAIWSTTARDMMDYPLAAFVRFFDSHGLLKLTNRPQWRTVAGGSIEYVRRLTAPFADSIRHDPVVRISRTPSGVELVTRSGHRDRFDEIVIATHADEALALLDDPSPQESGLLGAFRYTQNDTYLHTDTTLMPRRRRVWSSWNYISGSEPPSDRPLTVTYWMNQLQGLDPAHPLFVTLNPQVRPADEKTLRVFSYQHPLFDRRALNAQDQLWSLQGTNRTWFCGSYFGYGFHEDALQAGLAVAEQLSGEARPWKVAGEHRQRVNTNAPAAAANAGLATAAD